MVTVGLPVGATAPRLGAPVGRVGLRGVGGLRRAGKACTFSPQMPHEPKGTIRALAGFGDSLSIQTMILVDAVLR